MSAANLDCQVISVGARVWLEHIGEGAEYRTKVINRAPIDETLGTAIDQRPDVHPNAPDVGLDDETNTTVDGDILDARGDGIRDQHRVGESVDLEVGAGAVEPHDASEYGPD